MKPSDNAVAATAQTGKASVAAPPATPGVEAASAAAEPGSVPATTYRYTGPISGVTLADGQEVMLCPGADVTLPAAHDYTRTLLALGHLTPQVQAMPTPTQESANGS